MGITAGIVIHRTGRYIELLYLGTLLMTIGNGLYIYFSAHTSVALIIIFQLIAGLGTGLLFEAPLLPLQAMVSQQDTATATATFGFVRNLATSLSIVINGVIFQNSMDMRVPPLAMPPVNLPANITAALTGGKAAANVLLVERIEDLTQREAVREAFAWSMRNMWIFCTCVSVVTIAAVPFVARSHLSREHVETRTGIPSEKVEEVRGEDGVLVG